jgi:UDP-glucose-4-epimerase GalE
MILVTGGAGYIGSHAVQALRRAGFETLIFDNFSTGHRDFVGDTPFVEGDICNPEDLSRVFMRYSIEGVLHFAGKALIAESNRNPGLYYETNVMGGVRLLEAMNNAGTKVIIFSSSCATYGMPATSPITENTPQNPVNPYGDSKLAFERALQWFHRGYGIRYLALRYFNAAGAGASGERGEDHDPETHLIPLVLDAAMGRRPEAQVFGTDYPTPDGTCIRDYIHVTDLAEAHVTGLQRLLSNQIESQALNLGTGTGYSVREVIETVRKVTGLEFPLKELSRRDGDPPVLVAGVTRAKENLGWLARTSALEQIISSAWSWHQRRFGFR